ncbi:MAG: transporter substrate-binding domain-containing protein [Gemmatimonadota bacterium]|nr:MAG: transporter substrate-binding domain-containing protein [Gemmatimonadota bacterium]
MLLRVCVFIIVSVGLFAGIRKSWRTPILEAFPETGASEDQETSLQDRIPRNLDLASDIFDTSTTDLEGMMDVGRIRVLTTYTYNNFFTHKGKTYGYEYNLMEEYQDFLNSSLDRDGLKIEMYYIPLPYDLLIPALKKGYGDIVAANMTIHPERMREVDFTDPYQWNIREILVSNRDIKDMRNREQLSGRRIHVREGSSYHMSLRELNAKLVHKRLHPVDVVTLTGVIHTSDILEMVSAGVIQMTIADSHIAAIAHDLLPNLKINDHIVLNDNVRYGWMVRKNNPQLRANLNRFIKTIKKGTLKGNIYFERYFEENPWEEAALKREDLDQCCQYVPLFKKYGEFYGIDWMLLAAQAYQESRFNPRARSSAGAIGLMQVLPKTAREMEIGNLHIPENNIHAGVKYFNWIMENYFTEKEVSADDRIRFALAAYNAGPKKIRESRNVTADMGYDATKWFGNCELGTLKHVGPEPVYYVRSVNKNYLAFRMSKALKNIEQEGLENIMSPLNGEER